MSAHKKHPDTIAARIEALGPEVANQFWDDCQKCFGHLAGREVLRVLVSICDPLGSPLCATAEQTHAEIGRKEVVAELWRRSAPQIIPPQKPK